MTPASVVAAAEAFLAAMRREHAKRFPGRDARVPRLEDLNAADRRSMLVSIAAAVQAERRPIPVASKEQEMLP